MANARGTRDAIDEAEPLSRFAVRVGNEIRNPLAAILSAHEYIRKRVESEEIGSDPKVKHFLDIIEAELGAVTHVVNDLLDFGTQRPVHKSTILLRELIDEVTSQILIPPTVTLDNETDDTVAPVLLDRDKTRRALSQLVQNACDAVATLPAGHVWVRATLEPTDIVFDVSDDGPGVDPERLQELRAALFSTKAKGTGLGLAIADMLVRAQGGELTCKRRPEGGATFILRLPRA